MAVDEAEKLLISGSIISEYEGFWFLKNGEDRPVKINLVDLLHPNSFSVEVSETGDVLSKGPSRRIEVSDEDYFILGEKSEMKIFFEIPFYYDLSENENVLILKTESTSIPDIKFSFKGKKIFSSEVITD